MKRFSFATFLVDEGNRQAFQACQSVADLKPCERLPITILGDSGCGKTHLLYSIVNRVRATSSKTGLAYVTAHDFPDRVRQLIDDPSDVKRADSAVLLVDQLEQFGDLVEELEAVIRIFLDNNHYVVVASSVHPGRLQNITPGLRAILEGGMPVLISQHTSETRTELLKQQVRQESESVITKQRDEIQQLKTLVERIGRNGHVPDIEEPARLRKELENERAAREQLAKQLEIAKSLAASVQQDLADARVQFEQMRAAQAQPQPDPGQAATIEALQRESDSLRARLAEASEAMTALQARTEQFAARDEAHATLQREVDAMRVRLEEAERRAEALQFEVEEKSGHGDAQLASKHEELQQLHERVVSLHHESEEAKAALSTYEAQLAQVQQERDDLAAQLLAARNESANARKETSDLLERAERSLQTIEANRARLVQAEHDQRKQVEDLRVLLEQANERSVTAEELEVVKTQLLEAQARIESLTAEIERGNAEHRAREAELQTALDTTASDLEIALSRGDSLQSELSAAMDATESTQSELFAARATLESTQSDLLRAQEQINSLRQDLNLAQAESMEYKSAVDEAQAQLATLHADRAQLEVQLQHRNTTLDEANRTNQGLQGKVAELSATIEQRESEMEALRQEAAGQVAEAHAQAGELEGQLLRLQELYDLTRRATSQADDEVQLLQHQLAVAADGLAGLASRLAAASQGDFHVQHRQQDLFEALLSSSSVMAHAPQSLEEPSEAHEDPISSEELEPSDFMIDPTLLLHNNGGREPLSPGNGNVHLAQTDEHVEDPSNGHHDEMNEHEHDDADEAHRAAPSL